LNDIPNSIISNVAYSPQGDMILSTNHFKSVIELWDAETGQLCGALDGHTDVVEGIEYSPDGSRIASGSHDRTVRVWDAATKECLRVLEGHAEWVKGVAYSPQGNQLASASIDNTVRLWDVETGECRFILIGHSEAVQTVAYSMNGNLLASAGTDKILRLWDTVTGACRAVIENFQDFIRGVAWGSTSDANCLVAGNKDGSVLKWTVEEDEEEYRVRLDWYATNGKLNVIGTSMQDVCGLSHLNKQLLKQRGAIGEPAHALREAGKKLIAMGSVVSKLKQHQADAITGSSSVSSVTNSLSEQQQSEQSLAHQREKAKGYCCHCERSA
jgi:WD40 repeat protein